METTVMTRQTLIGLITGSKGLEIRIYIQSLDGFIAVKKTDLLIGLKEFHGPRCNGFSVSINATSNIMHIQGVD